VNILLAQLDGALPNFALMRIAAHHRALGDHVELRRWAHARDISPELMFRPDRVYASAIFAKSRNLVDAVRHQFPGAIVGGTGSGNETTLEQIGVDGWAVDYADFPAFTSSIGFTQRGCRQKCPFCVVPRKEGAVSEAATIAEIWRGDPWPRDIVLLDNDFFGQPRWRDRIDELRAGKFRVSFCQGINVRAIGDEEAAAIASVDYRSLSMRERRIYAAWDNRKDEARLFAGLERLVAHGVSPRNIMVYVLVGYWPGETAVDREYRRRRLRDFGAVPYPMPFERTRELVGFQRWITGAYDKRVPWDAWVRNGYRPEGLVLPPNDPAPVSAAG